MSMRIATYNVNGINGRLANLLGWPEEATPDIVCLQELKAADDKFPAAAIRAAGYGAIWHGAEKLEWRWQSSPGTPSRRRPAAVYPVIPMIRKVATSKQR